MNDPQANNPLHGVTLEMMVTQLVEHYGWDELGQIIDVRCFNFDPSIKSSLKFLRKTPWARTKVEQLYLRLQKNRRAGVKISRESVAAPKKWQQCRGPAYVHSSVHIIRMSTVARRETKRQAAKELLRLTFKEWWNDDSFRYSASLAFYTIFSLAPVLLIAVGVASLFLAPDTAPDRIVAEVRHLVGDEGAKAVKQIIEASKGFGKNASAIAIGIVTFIFGATVVFIELQSALNKIWDVQADPKRGVIAKLIIDRLRSFTIALGVGFLLLVSLVISAVLSGVQSYMNNWIPGFPLIWQTLNTVTSFFIAALLFAMIYKYLPDVKIAWRDVRVGAIVTAALFTIGKHLIGLYLGQTAAASAYGAAGSFAVLLIWIYYSALISFFGAEFTQVFARRYGSKIHPEEHAERVGEKSDSL